MHIAVNTRLLLDKLEGYGYFTSELFKQMVQKHPEHQFYFLFDRPFNRNYIFAENVHPIVIRPAARLPILWKYWFDIKVPAVLRRINADVFVSPDGYCSLRTKVPQCVVIHDLGFLHFPEAYKKSHLAFLKVRTPKFLQKAKRIVTVSNFSKKDILDQYKTEASKVDVVYNGVKDIFRPLSQEERISTKEKFTEGAEYFIYAGAVQPRKNLINLLKAFSIFKKRMQSSMKLVIAGRLAWKNEEFIRLFNAYKYRGDVILTGYLQEEELAMLVGSAYGMVYPSLFEGFGVPVAEALKCGVAVLTSEKTSMQEVAGDAALYFDPIDYNDIADKLMTIYRDENLKRQLAEKGRLQVGKYSWEKSAELFWQSILKTVEE